MSQIKVETYHYLQKIYSNYSEFFVDLAWHATLTGVTIYNRTILEQNLNEKYFNTNFIQLGILLDLIIDTDKPLCWLNNQFVALNLRKKSSYWENDVF